LERVKYELNRCWYSAEVMNAHTIAFRLVGSGKRFTMSNQKFNPASRRPAWLHFVILNTLAQVRVSALWVAYS
jgi:hypothetical protein